MVFIFTSLYEEIFTRVLGDITVYLLKACNVDALHFVLSAECELSIRIIFLNSMNAKMSKCELIIENQRNIGCFSFTIQFVTPHGSLHGYVYRRIPVISPGLIQLRKGF